MLGVNRGRKQSATISRLSIRSSWSAPVQSSDGTSRHPATSANLLGGSTRIRASGLGDKDHVQGQLAFRSEKQTFCSFCSLQLAWSYNGISA